MNAMILNLLVAHVVGDFYCQCKSMCDKKIIESNRLWSPTIFIHSAIIGVLSMIVLWDSEAWKVVLAIFLSHYAIDLGKSFISRKFNFVTVEKKEGKDFVKDGLNHRYYLWLFLADQFLHILAIIAAVSWFESNDWEQIKCVADFISSYHMLAKAILACAIACKPSNILVRLILKACEVKIQNDDRGNFRSGALIGSAERCLILAFVILDKYEAIGFLLGAKSILRFGQTQGESENEKSEYVLAGTLVSLAIALCLGLAVIKLPF